MRRAVWLWPALLLSAAVAAATGDTPVVKVFATPALKMTGKRQAPPPSDAERWGFAPKSLTTPALKMTGKRP